MVSEEVTGGGSWNLRGYALQDPINAADPDGLQAATESGLLRALLTSGPSRFLFGRKPPGILNGACYGQYLRIGLSKSEGQLVFRIAGLWWNAVCKQKRIIARLGPL